MVDFKQFGINSIENIPAILESDFYKQSHAEQYPDGTAELVSYATARMSRMKGQDKLIVFGIQAFIKRFLIENFNKTFFERDFDDVMEFYKLVMGDTFPLKYVDIEKFRELHELGYLPIEVACLPEGTKVPIRNASKIPEGQCQVPFMYFRNTKPGFAWVTEFLESLASSEIWYPMCVANQALLYRQIVNEWYIKTGVNDDACKSAISEFGFRGGKGKEAATLASSAFLTSFNKTATIPAIIYNAMYYNEDMKDGRVGSGMISTEHSVMCSNKAIDDAEETFLRRLLTEIYPTGAVSAVCDSWDYWNCVEKILGETLHEVIMQRDGCLFVRGDSGDPVDIICGEQIGFSKSFIFAEGEQCWYKFKDGTWVKHNDKPVEIKGTVELLWDLFGGTVNEKGYKVLDKHVRCIYGDSITPVRAEQIYKRLEEKGFAACNVALGAGSFSMNCVEGDNGELYPFTRDSYGIAVKATYAKNTNEEEYQLFKNPKTDTGKFKKSQKGLIHVREEEGRIVAYDGYDSKTFPKEENMLQVVFRDGKMIKETTLTEIRERIHDNRF